MPSTAADLPSPAVLADAVLDALPGRWCVLDAAGRLLRTNRAWRDFAQASGLDEGDPAADLGVNSLGLAAATLGGGADTARQAVVGLRAVLAGAQDEYTLDYACHASGELRWSRLSCRRLQLVHGCGALLGQLDITGEVLERQGRLRLDQSFKAYRLLFDANPQPMWVYDSVTLRFCAVNDAALARYGYVRDEFLGLRLLDIRPASEHHKFLAELAQLPPATDRCAEWLHQARDGRVFTVRITSHAIEWAGRPARLVLAEDITPRTTAETALRESEQRLRQMADNLSEVFWLNDVAQGQMLFVSSAYERIWGQTVDALLRDPGQWLLTVDPVDRERVAAAVARQGAGESEIQYGIQRPDGERRRIAARSAPIVDADGVVRRVAGVARDITAKYEQEQRLRLLEQAVARLNDIVLITEAEPFDEPGPRIVFVNDAFERRTGYKREEVIGRSPRLLQGAATQRPELDRIRKALMAWQPVRAELINYTKDGQPFWLELDIVPLADSRGWFTHWVSVERDITERKAHEEQARQAQRLESLGQLTGGVAHDFNNLLTVMLGNAEVLAERLPLGTSERRLADMIGGAAQRGADLTQRLLAFARRQPLQPRATNLNRLLGDLDGLLRRSLGTHIEIEAVRASDLWSTFVDRAQLENAVLNLGINARDAMPGGGRLTLETANAHLDQAHVRHHEGMKPGQYVMLAVSDTGHGIDPKDLGRVFEPFFTTKAMGKGTGLGLAMVYGFIKQSGGHVAIYSEPGRGTTLRIYLPRHAEASEATESATVDELEQRGQGQLILLVEDDAMVREYASSQLQLLGYRVVEAGDAREALELLRQQSDIALLFTDVVMPGGMDGRSLADAVKALRAELPVLFTSGYTENAMVHHGRLDAGVALLGKPYRRHELARRVHATLATPSIPLAR